MVGAVGVISPGMQSTCQGKEQEREIQISALTTLPQFMSAAKCDINLISLCTGVEAAPPVGVDQEEEEEEGEDGEEGVVEDNTDAGGAEGDDGDDGMMDSENFNIKLEAPDDSGSTERCYSSLLTLASVLDAEVLLQAVGHKVGYDRMSNH